MLFNTFEFFVFFAVVYALYLVSSHKWQNRLLLVASYVFYGWWDWRFLSLIIISTVLDYFCGLAIQQGEDIRRRKLFLSLSVAGNLGILGFFKYFNFFALSLQRLLGEFGAEADFRLLHIVLPVGISFYTFQTMSYTIDIYRREMEPTKRFLDFAVFVAFFPQLVAGPIERASRLLPQVLKPRRVTWEGFWEGSYLIGFGLFKKVFVADNLAAIVNPVFKGYGSFNGAEVLVALYAFAFQIYCDFSGYSDIARGLGKCMGFDIMVNFHLPYFARNPSDFWRRWHISLSTWLRDYLYVPLGGSRKGTLATYRNLAITMFLGGLWHGAAWTFVMWGVYQGLILIIHRLVQPYFKLLPLPNSRWLSRLGKAVSIVFFFHVTCVGWLLFRAQWGEQALDMMKGLFFHFSLTQNVRLMFVRFLFFALPLICIQFYQYFRDDLMAPYKRHWCLRAILYAWLFYLVATFGVTGGAEFIYFQF